MSQAISLRTRSYAVAGSVAAWGTGVTLAPFQLLAAAPSMLFLGTLTAMLLRHPDVDFYEIDRIAFGLLVLGVLARAVVRREQIFKFERATWPMLALTLFALGSLAGEPFDHETWSLLAAKFLVPFTLFHLARLVFTEEKHFRQFEIFGLIVLAYLSFTAIAFLIGTRDLIFPRFILDESLGHHADRARGPLLQAVANGVSLNMLGLLAWHSYSRRSVGGGKMVVLLASVPVAIVATMTRTVWLSFAATVLGLVILSRKRVVVWMCVIILVFAGGLLVTLSSTQWGGALTDRLQEQGPVDYRAAVYAGGWEMFLQRPVFGWGFHQMPDELPRHVSGYQEKVLYPHNTYLELLVEHGLVGLAAYVWLMWELWRLGRVFPEAQQVGFLNRNFRRLWLLLLAVYWLNAATVVMSYQFVNGILFTLAGMLAAQNRSAEVSASC